MLRNIICEATETTKIIRMNNLLIHRFKKNIDMFVYHFPCVDGFCSASICHMYYEQYNLPHPEYYGINYGSELSMDKIIGKNVLIADFSFGHKTIMKMIESCNSIGILDHHKTAEKELEHINNKYKVFDMNRCGADLTYEFFYNSTLRPLFVRYVSDNDLWTKKLDLTDEFSSLMKKTKFDFETYIKYILNDNLLIKDIITFGKTYHESDLDLIKREKYNISFVRFPNGMYGFMGYFFNSPDLRSEKCNYMLLRPQYKHLNLVGTFNSDWLNEEDLVSVSLRSSNDRYDVSKIAKLYNGGGHRNASGMRISKKQSKEMMSYSKDLSEYLFKVLDSVKLITPYDPKYKEIMTIGEEKQCDLNKKCKKICIIHIDDIYCTSTKYNLNDYLYLIIKYLTQNLDFDFDFDNDNNNCNNKYHILRSVIKRNQNIDLDLTSFNYIAFYCNGDLYEID